MKPSSIVLIYNGTLFILVTGALGALWRLRPEHRGGLFLLLSAVIPLVAVAGAFASPVAGFAKIQLLAWAVFGHCPILLVGGAWVVFRQRRGVALACIALALGLLAIAIDAFLIEPHWLAVDYVTIPSRKLERDIRVAVMADVQTDRPGRYEKRVLRRVGAEEPDLILLAGDYVHLEDAEAYAAARRTLNRMMREAKLDATLGVYAVRGNVDWPGMWQGIFADLPVTTFERSQTLDLGPLTLTGLTLQDSADTRLAVAPEDGFHIVLGHVPNFSLGQIEADVLVAGHTHGGQVQLPVVGPLLTLSQVPRRWASGPTEIEPGKTLIVSRGIGLERGQAPRMRFLCRPQLVILDLVALRA